MAQYSQSQGIRPPFVSTSTIWMYGRYYNIILSSLSGCRPSNRLPPISFTALLHVINWICFWYIVQCIILTSMDDDAHVLPGTRVICSALFIPFLYNVFIGDLSAKRERQQREDQFNTNIKVNFIIIFVLFADDFNGTVYVF